jgi:signal transduction histidine kinase
MKLLTLTTRYYLLLFLLILTAWSAVFYAVMKYEVYENTDEILFNRKNRILDIIESSGEVPLEKDEYNDFVIQALEENSSISVADQFSDTLIYEPTDEEFDEYRKLTTRFQASGRIYQLIIFKPRLETTEIVNTISFTLTSLYLVLVVGLVITSRLLSRKLWGSFYDTLNKLRQYRVDKESELQFSSSHIQEFEELNDSLAELTQRNYKIFINQKQFIENASHEIQTPLAIIQSKIELLFQWRQLEDEQAQILNSVLLETERLSKLNNTLLLLSKIENNQFSDRIKVVLKPIIEKTLLYFEEQAEKYKISIQMNVPPEAHVHTNPMLMEILLTNLIKNAFVHNIINGHINISVKERVFNIENTGEALTIPPEKLFSRFSKQSKSKGALGLGLSIVKTICDINKWNIKYSYQENIHKISILY